MKAVIEIEFEIDGETPPVEKLETMAWEMISDANYIGSEEIDGTDDWGVELGCRSVRIDGYDEVS